MVVSELNVIDKMAALMVNLIHCVEDLNRTITNSYKAKGKVAKPEYNQKLSNYLAVQSKLEFAVSMITKMSMECGRTIDKKDTDECENFDNLINDRSEFLRFALRFYDATYGDSTGQKIDAIEQFLISITNEQQIPDYVYDRYLPIDKRKN